MGQLQIKMQGQFEISKKKSTITFCSQLGFVWMKASLVACGVIQKLEIKIVLNEYVRGFPKWPATQIWSLKDLGVKRLITWVEKILCGKKKRKNKGYPRKTHDYYSSGDSLKMKVN
jgi:hypothetical protein